MKRWFARRGFQSTAGLILVCCGHLGVDTGPSVQATGGTGGNGSGSSTGGSSSGGVASGGQVSSGGGPSSGGSSGGMGPTSGGTSSGGRLGVVEQKDVVLSTDIPSSDVSSGMGGSAGAAGAPSYDVLCETEQCACKQDSCSFLCMTTTTKCGARCEEGVPCDVHSGTTSQLEARCNGARCKVVAAPDSSLSIEVRERGDFAVDCTAAAQCSVTAEGPGVYTTYCSDDAPCSMKCQAEKCTLVGSFDLECTVALSKYLCANGARCGLPCTSGL